MELVEFLRARLDDVERTAGNYVRFEVRDGIPGNYAIRDEVLREVEAKRRIIDSFARFVGHARAQRDHETTILKALALPYADAPGYRDEWKP